MLDGVRSDPEFFDFCGALETPGIDFALSQALVQFASREPSRFPYGQPASEEQVLLLLEQVMEANSEKVHYALTNGRHRFVVRNAMLGRQFGQVAHVRP